CYVASPDLGSCRRCMTSWIRVPENLLDGNRIPFASAARPIASFSDNLMRLRREPLQTIWNNAKKGINEPCRMFHSQQSPHSFRRFRAILSLHRSGGGRDGVSQVVCAGEGVAGGMAGTRRP